MPRIGNSALAAFCIALILLLYTRSRTIYDHTPDNLGSSNGRKVIVLASTGSEDVSWVHDYLPDWHHAIYDLSLSSPTPRPGMHAVPVTKGHDAMAYLTYIIDHYDNLPAFIAFVHANRTAHAGSINDNAAALSSLRLNYVQEHGYTSLRCSWNPGCPKGVNPWGHLYGAARPWEGAMPLAWQHLFGSHPRFPGILGAPSGSQFVVPRWQILKRRRYEYAHYREWLVETRLSEDNSGKVMEFLWHVVFGRAAVYCPDEYRCACDQFGRC